MFIRLGLIARWPPDAEGESLSWDAYESRVVSSDQVINIIPWSDAPQTLRDLALDRWKPKSRPYSLVILRSGDILPSPCNVHRKWAKRQRCIQRRLNQQHRRKPQTVEDGLRDAGWATVQDVADDTGYSEDHLRLLAREGKVAARKVEHRWWLHRKSVDIYAQRRHPSGRGRRRGAEQEK